ncbi:hypothetical protein K443DRAFT_13463 [Laccaria amethystina LaAM-08-1]|uniref:Aminoglycoside phosphotransferase domain-containing protein n=1 Tax=Laccaria amethystina LaAM-08-1 TaxID=1095629 RepID=A0A0C9X8F8_9AGAR|nr:hypothetical protein K443DRAFT_13463 [Laccaria amethystina LaAM-08-1]
MGHSSFAAFPSHIRIFVYRLLMTIGMKLYPEHGLLTRTTQRLPFNLLILSHHEPVPLILDVVEGVTEDNLFVLITRVPGVQVGKAYEDMDERARELMKEQLCDWINQLQSLPVPPLLTIPNFLCGACKVDRIASSAPISTVEEAHELTLSYVAGDERDRVIETARRRSYSKRHRICFTHGDLRPRNVLVQAGRLSGLVNFGSSGGIRSIGSIQRHGVCRSGGATQSCMVSPSIRAR